MASAKTDLAPGAGEPQASNAPDFGFTSGGGTNSIDQSGSGPERHLRTRPRSVIPHGLHAPDRGSHRHARQMANGGAAPELGTLARSASIWRGISTPWNWPIYFPLF
jgi:hypothetical protein